MKATGYGIAAAGFAIASALAKGSPMSVTFHIWALVMLLALVFTKGSGK